jgi:hypothetical protein
MTVRSDIVVNWALSPRIITVLAPSTELVVQDLIDTCRFLEEQEVSFNHLINAGGKEPIGAGILVGITCSLQNALLAFEGRIGPDYITATLSGGNLVAVDDLGAPISDPYVGTPFVNIRFALSSSGIITQAEGGESAISQRIEAKADNLLKVAKMNLALNL